MVLKYVSCLWFWPCSKPETLPVPFTAPERLFMLGNTTLNRLGNDWTSHVECLAFSVFLVKVIHGCIFFFFTSRFPSAFAQSLTGSFCSGMLMCPNLGCKKKNILLLYVFRLICQLFSELIVWVIKFYLYSIKIENSENAHLQIAGF